MVSSSIFFSVFKNKFEFKINKNWFIRNPHIVGEYGDYFEGDMHLTNEQMDDLFSPAKNGLVETKYRWPNKTVPYQLSMDHTKDQRDYIEKALKTLESVSCVKFVRRTNEEDYVELTVRQFVERPSSNSFFFHDNISSICRQRMTVVIPTLDSDMDAKL